MTELADAFPRRPAPHREPPDLSEVEAAKATFAVHIRSLFSRDCLGCSEDWPCGRRRAAEVLLDRAGLIDVNGDLRA